MPDALPILPPALDYAGVAVFALTGALAAARAKHDLVTFLFFAVVTGVGGGTLRDLLIGAPVFWISDATYLAIGAVAALIVWLFAERLEGASALIWIDAVGLAAYAVIGAGKALALGVEPAVAAAMGVLTARFGGVLRDVIANQPSIFAEARNLCERRFDCVGHFCCARHITHADALGRRDWRACRLRGARRRDPLWLGAARLWRAAKMKRAAALPRRLC